MKTERLLLALLLLPLLVRADEDAVSMWLIEGEKNRVYLLGSVHLLRKQDHPLPAVLDAAYADAEALVMELDLDDIDPLALQAETNRLGMLRDGTTLQDSLGAKKFAIASAAAQELEIPLDLLAQTEPWFAAITVEQLVLMRIGFNPLYGIEMHMAMKASQDAKPITGLETVDEQLAFLDGLSPDAQGDLLLQTLAEGRNAEEEMGRLVDAWRRGDTRFLEQNMLAQMQESEELYDAIVVRRNEAWLDDIVALLDDDDDYLVIVGTLHLIGPDGVPALLEKQGIEARQMHESL